MEVPDVKRLKSLDLTWSMDFVMDAPAAGRRINCLTCVDNVKKECLTITAAFGISGGQLTRILDSIALFRGYPATIRTDQGLVYLQSIWPVGL